MSDTCSGNEDFDFILNQTCSQTNVNVDNNLDVNQSILTGTLDGWSQLANCKGYAQLFFGKRAERPQARVRREGKAHTLCQVCTVQPNCRAFARNNHEYGYWGDENEESRHDAGFILSSPIGVRVTPIAHL